VHSRDSGWALQSEQKRPERRHFENKGLLPKEGVVNRQKIGTSSGECGRKKGRERIGKSFGRFLGAGGTGADGEGHLSKRPDCFFHL